MISILSLFSGIGAFESALDRIGCHYQLTGYCEIDPYASKSYAQIHGVSERLNLRDVTTINTVLINLLGGVDLITYGFPCQDISVAGKQRGFTDTNGNRTRSGLFFEALRIIEGTRPLYAIAENVKALTSKKFKKEFKTVLDSLDGAGYNNYWAVLNAKDFGIPQNRERVFIVSIRKDIDKGGFKFPGKMPLNIRVKDILETEVDEKYCINTEKARQLIKKLLDKNRITGVKVCDATVNAPNVRDISRSWGTAVIEPPVICRSSGRNPDNPSDRTAGIPTEQRLEPNTDGVSNTLTTVQKDNYVLEAPKILQVGNIVNTGNFKNPQRGRIYHPDGLAPTLNTCGGGGLEPKFIQPVIIGSTQKHAAVKNDGVCPCLTACMEKGGGQIPMLTVEQPINCCGYRIRKLTPLECFRLMGFSDEEFNRIKGVSNSQLYKQAGNSIVVDVLAEIFNRLLTEEEKHDLAECNERLRSIRTINEDNQR